MNTQHGIQYWKDQFQSARGKTVESIIDQGKIVAAALAEGITSRDYAEALGISQGQVNHLSLIGRDTRLNNIVIQLPDSWGSLYECTQLTDEQLALVTPDMTRAQITALRGPSADAPPDDDDAPPRAVVPPLPPVSRGIRAILQSHGLLDAHPNATSTNAAKARVKAVDPEIIFDGKKPSPEMAARIDAAAARVAFAKGLPMEERVAREVANGEYAEIAKQVHLAKTADEKLQAAIRVHKKILDNEFNERVNERVTEKLRPMLADYNRENDKNVAANEAYKGVYTEKEYKMILGALHADRYQNLDETQLSRLNRAFQLVESKRWQLAAIRDDTPSTLPKTVEDLLKMRRKPL